MKSNVYIVTVYPFEIEKTLVCIDQYQTNQAKCDIEYYKEKH